MHVDSIAQVNIETMLTQDNVPKICIGIERVMKISTTTTNV